MRIPDGDAITPWGKAKHELYDEGVARFEAAKAAGLHPDPFPWLAEGRESSEMALRRTE